MGQLDREPMGGIAFDSARGAILKRLAAPSCPAKDGTGHAEDCGPASGALAPRGAKREMQPACSMFGAR